MYLINLVGELNDGWRVATSLLTFERSGIERLTFTRRLLDELIEFARTEIIDDESVQEVVLVKQKLAEMAIECEIGRLLAYRVAWMQQNGQNPQGEASMSKVFGSELMQRTASRPRSLSDSSPTSLLSNLRRASLTKDGAWLSCDGLSRAWNPCFSVR